MTTHEEQVRSFTDPSVPTPASDMEPSMESQRDMLAQAIAEAGAKVGIIDPEMPLTGPQLLMVLDDLVSIITAKAPKTCECGDPDCLKGSQSFTPDKE